MSETSRPPCASVVERREVKPAAVFQPIRVAIAGTHRLAGDLREPDAARTEESLARIDAALAASFGAGGLGDTG